MFCKRPGAIKENKLYRYYHMAENTIWKIGLHVPLQVRIDLAHRLPWRWTLRSDIFLWLCCGLAAPLTAVV